MDKTNFYQCDRTKCAENNNKNVRFWRRSWNSNVFTLLVLVEGYPDPAKLTTKLNELRESVQKKNKLDFELKKELQETKEELQTEKEKFRKELNEREMRERSLQDSKRKLQKQLTEMEKQTGDLLEELSLLQVCIILCKRFFNCKLRTIWMRLRDIYFSQESTLYDSLRKKK